MSFEKAIEYLKQKGYEDRVETFDVSSATVELAAEALGTEPGKIAKSLTFKVDEKPIMILCAGDVKINSSKFKKIFGVKPKMLAYDEVSAMIGHSVGGVCPFGINEGVNVFLDESLKMYDIVYPACGSDNSSVKLSITELEDASDYKEWIDVCVKR